MWAAAHACAWDNDTLVAEIKGLPTVTDAIIGRIPVNPPEYYKRRIEISETALKADPSKLEHYDNLAVAYDKLGNFEKAMKAMISKKTQMGKMELANDDHDYRYHANVGTIFAHEWVRQQPNGEPAMLELAIAEIAKAIEINPDAHFGREKIQLRLLETLAEVAGVRKEGEHTQASWREFATETGSDKVVEGVIGIMALGTGPDNRDLIAILMASLDSEQGNLAHLALLRDEELEKAGKKRWIKEDNQVEFSALEDGTKKRAKRSFIKLREDAKNFQAHRTAYILKQIKAGRHPDTHADFWNGYKERPRLILSAGPTSIQSKLASFLFIWGSVAAAIVGIWIFLRIRKWRKAKAT